MTKRIGGAGGGRKPPSNPVPFIPVQQTVIVQLPEISDDPNSLFSKSSIRIVDLLSEGEIAGFANSDAAKSIFLDGTPLRNDDDTDNFVFDSFETRLGTQDQDHVPGFPASETINIVNAEVGDDIDDFVVRTATKTNSDRLIVRVVIAQLFRVDNGLKATTVGYDIQIQASGGSYVSQGPFQISGKCTSPYERSHNITLTGSGPWNIKLIRTLAASSEDNPRALAFGGFTEVVDGKLRHPLSALSALRFEATQFQQVPTRSYDIKGIKVQIPSNATVDSTNGRLVYSGIWDGSFYVAWCADPAWIMRDLILSNRYGLGDFVSAAEVDKWSLYEISKYTNQLINDGQGSTEPRFLCNVYLQSQDEAFNVIQDFASIFRGMAYWSAGQIAFSADRPSDPVALFNNSNVINGDFSYEGSSLKARHTVALVTWNDPETDYQQKVEYVSDEDAIAKFGIIETRVAAFACTSRGQANRAGRWLLYQEQNENSTVTFKVGLDGAIVRPGQIIKVMDEMRAGARKAGRVASYSGTTLTIDRSIAVAPNDTISVVLPDGSVEQRTIASAVFDDKQITVSSGFSQTPARDTVFLIETTTLEAQLFRVVSVVEDDQIFTITALEHNTSKYDFVEDGLALQPRTISTLNVTPASVTGISVSEQLVEAGNRVTTEVEISWVNVQFASAYQVSFKTENSASYTTIGDTPYNNITLLTDEVGKFTFRVVAMSAIGKRAPATEFVTNIAGNTAAPADVQNFSMIPVNGQARLTWAEATDLDVRVGGYVLLRHTPDLSGAEWQNSVSISEEIAGAATEAYADLKQGTYLAKFVDSGGRQSLNASLIEFTKPDLGNVFNVNTQTEHPTFAGTKTNLVVDTDLGELQLNFSGEETPSLGTMQLEEDPFVFLLEDGNQLLLQGNAAFETTGTYLFTNNPITLSDIFSVSLESTIKVRGFFPYNQFLDDIADFDSIANFDGASPLSSNVELYIRTTQDDPAGSPTYTSWRKYNNAEFRARAYELKAEVSTENNTTQLAVQQLEVVSNLPIRTITDTVTTSASADVSVTYANKFAATPAVGIQFTTQATGDYYVISNSAATGFDVSVYNSSNTRIARAVTWTATGYGKN